MYVRSKIVKGRTYYQIVEGVRFGSAVRQKVVMSLGTIADPAVALEDMKWRLAATRAEFDRGKVKAAPRMVRLEMNVEKLSSILGRDLIGSPPRRCTTSARRRAYHEAGHAVSRFSAGFKVEYVTIEPHEGSGGHIMVKGKLKSEGLPWGLCGEKERWQLLRDVEWICAGAAAEAIDNPKRFGDRFYFNGDVGMGGSDLQQAVELIEQAGLDQQAIETCLCQGYSQAKARSASPRSGARSRR